MGHLEWAPEAGHHHTVYRWVNRYSEVRPGLARGSGAAVAVAVVGIAAWAAATDRLPPGA